MYSLIAVPLIIVWLWISIVIVRWIGKKIPYPRARIAVVLVLIPALFVSPLADEIIGKYQFDKLCKEAEEVKIYGTLPVGEELYTADGKWRRSHTVPLLSLEDSNKVSQKINSLLRYERNEIYGISAAIPISGSENRVFSRNTGQLLAVYRIFGTRGGWLSRNLEKPLVVRDQCLPKEHLEIERRILPFNKASNEK